MKLPVSTSFPPTNFFSGIFGPDGRLIGDGLIDDEGIVYAEIDLRRCIQPKQMHDIVGHYNRFDIFDLSVNRKPMSAARFIDNAGPDALQGLDLTVSPETTA